MFGGEPATHCGLAFYDLDKIVFASDCPFDPEKGTMYTRETLRILEGIDMPKADKEKIWHGNLERDHGREVQELTALTLRMPAKAGTAGAASFEPGWIARFRGNEPDVACAALRCRSLRHFC